MKRRRSTSIAQLVAHIEAMRQAEAPDGEHAERERRDHEEDETKKRARARATST